MNYNSNIDLNGYDDFIDISQIEPDGVFCLYTAMHFYNLSTFISDKYYMTIPRKKWIKKALNNYPIIIKKWQYDNFNLGIDLINVDKFTFKIYNIEKTVCDCVRYRKEIGLNTLKEVLIDYLQFKNKNLNKLSLYAKKLHVDKILKEYIGMLI